MSVANLTMATFQFHTVKPLMKGWRDVTKRLQEDVEKVDFAPFIPLRLSNRHTTQRQLFKVDL